MLGAASIDGNALTLARAARASELPALKADTRKRCGNDPLQASADRRIPLSARRGAATMLLLGLGGGHAAA